MTTRARIEGFALIRHAAELVAVRIKEVESALQLAYRVLDAEKSGTRLAREVRVGLKQTSVFRQFRRDYWTLFAIARELGCQMWELEGAEEVSSRLPYEDILGASEHVRRVVVGFPPHIKDVVEMRARRVHWRKIMAALPGRVYVSVVDDYLRVLGRLAELREITLLTSYVVKNDS